MSVCFLQPLFFPFQKLFGLLLPGHSWKYEYCSWLLLIQIRINLLLQNGLNLVSTWKHKHKGNLYFLILKLNSAVKGLILHTHTHNTLNPLIIRIVKYRLTIWNYWFSASKWKEVNLHNPTLLCFIKLFYFLTVTIIRFLTSILCNQYFISPSADLLSSSKDKVVIDYNQRYYCPAAPTIIMHHTSSQRIELNG